MFVDTVWLSEENYLFCQSSKANGWDIDSSLPRVQIHSTKTLVGYSGEFWVPFIWYVKWKDYKIHNTWKTGIVTMGYKDEIMKWILNDGQYETIIESIAKYSGFLELKIENLPHELFKLLNSQI